MKVEIDAARRMLHARVHSAGHLLDSAFTHIGVTDLIPEKVNSSLIVRTHWITHLLLFPQGYHFPEGPYVRESVC